VSVAAIIVAAGRGTRLRMAGSAPKQYLDLAGQTILARTVGAFLGCAAVSSIQVVIHREDEALYANALDRVSDPARDAGGRELPTRLLPPVFGGATRQQSVRNGLEAIKRARPQTEVVLIHDAARPFVTDADICAVIDATRQSGAAIAAVPVSDTLKRACEDGAVEATVSRQGLWRALTPQGFRLDDILTAHREQAQTARPLTDDAAVAEAHGIAVRIVVTDPGNFKITTLEDLGMAERTLLASQTINGLPAARVPDVRHGTGFDVHRFCPGNHIWLCGVKVPHSESLAGHSDADVGLHALTDAVFGAMADGDIGHHFPPSDPQWKGAASDQFLSYAAQRVVARGGTITNADVTLICEAPKIGPHRDAMRARIAEILGVSMDRIGVKATTSEGLGFPGRREGIAAMASATLVIAGGGQAGR